MSHYHNPDLAVKKQLLIIEDFCNDIINKLEINYKDKKEFTEILSKEFCEEKDKKDKTSTQESIQQILSTSDTF